MQGGKQQNICKQDKRGKHNKSIIIIIIIIFIIYMQSQQLQSQLQTEPSVDTDNYIKDKHNMKSRVDYRKVLDENTLMQESKINKQANKPYER
jgi:hypothetical protein